MFGNDGEGNDTTGRAGEEVLWTVDGGWVWVVVCEDGCVEEAFGEWEEGVCGGFDGGLASAEVA